MEDGGNQVLDLVEYLCLVRAGVVNTVESEAQAAAVSGGEFQVGSRRASNACLAALLSRQRPQPHQDPAPEICFLPNARRVLSIK